MEPLKHLAVMAENFGFGPASIAISISAELRRCWPGRVKYTFLGDGVALQLARCSSVFDACEEVDINDSRRLSEALERLPGIDHALNVVAPVAAVRMLERGVATSYVDPLFWFFDAIDPRLKAADNYFVQVFSDFESDKRRLDFQGPNIREVGWILPRMQSRRRMRADIQAFCGGAGERALFERILDREQPFVLVNLGGVDNFIFRGFEYPETVRDVLVPAIREYDPRIPILFIGGGEWMASQARSANASLQERNLWFGTVPQHWSWFLASGAEKAFISCGLSNLSEAVFQKADAFGLPAQNYSQHLQQRRMREWNPGWRAFDYPDFDDRHRLPAFLPEGEGVERIRQIVQNLRDFSRVDTTQGFRLFDVHRAIETTLGIVRSLTGSAVRFATYFDELPLVECNPTELNQVLMNILVNATQAVDQNGSVEIHTGRGPHHVWIEIKDDGCGIEEHVLPRIFEPFFTTKDVGRGTGLGLSISYGIVRKHGGDITVRSRIGAGTVFLITLPVKQAGATQDSSE